MSVISHRCLHFSAFPLSPNPLFWLSSTTLHILCFPCRATTSFLPSGSIHFPTPFPSLRYWARFQVFVGGQNNYTETLIETKKTPCVMSWMAPDLCCFSPSVRPSVTNKRICHHSKQNSVAKESFHSSPLPYRKTTVTKTLSSRVLPYPMRRG